MKKLVMAAVAAVALASAGSASAATVFDFQLNGNLNNAAANAVTLTNNAGVGSLGATGITFGVNAGPTVNGLGALDAYTLEMAFRLDATSGYRKLVDFSNRSDDRGLYAHNSTLNFFNLKSGLDAVISPNELVKLTLTRSGGVLTGAIDGVQQFTVDDPGSFGVITNTLHFFRDDSSVSGEASGGFVDYIRLADAGGFTAVPTAPGAVPEPATWAMMLLGFFGLGGVLRANKRAGRELGPLRVA